MSLTADVRKYRGVVLGHPALCERSPHTWYRFRLGRALALGTAAGLPREWMLAYCRWYEARGKHGEAQRLRKEWLAAPRKAGPLSELRA